MQYSSTCNHDCNECDNKYDAQFLHQCCINYQHLGHERATQKGMGICKQAERIRTHDADENSIRLYKHGDDDGEDKIAGTVPHDPSHNTLYQLLRKEQLLATSSSGMNDCFPSVMTHLEEILDALYVQTQHFHVGNKRSKVCSFMTKSKNYNGVNKKLSAQTELIMNENTECELLMAHINQLMNKWRRQSSLSTEILIMVSECIEIENNAKKQLESELIQKQNLIQALSGK